MMRIPIVLTSSASGVMNVVLTSWRRAQQPEFAVGAAAGVAGGVESTPKPCLTSTAIRRRHVSEARIDVSESVAVAA